MTSDRIKEIQEQTAYPESVSVKQALLQVWNECQQQLEKERDQHNINMVAFANFLHNKLPSHVHNSKQLYMQFLTQNQSNK